VVESRCAAVIGTTSWATTLAILLARSGIETRLWARTESEFERLRQDGENKARVPDVPFPQPLSPTADLRLATAGASLIVIAVPSVSFRENVQRLSSVDLDPDAIVIGATKGLERGTGRRMSEIFQEEIGSEISQRYGSLSGPNLAKEIAHGRPSSAVVASADPEVAARAQEMFNSPLFRVYTNTDVVGVELGGALKNILAIGAGLADGMGYGDNGKAALISRGLAEITRLGVAGGAQALTFSGLAGIGDLIATCYSPLSRNRFIGQEIAKGRSPGDVLESLGQVAEGVDTTSAALVLANQLGVDMPITEQTRRVLLEGLDPRQALNELMARAPKAEYPSRG
jgi:glycerol-3-phosphate dehydrogenase (NAD(P)+)